MAKTVRFPLKMKDNIEVRTMGELKENWDMEKIVGYFLDGKLTTWLTSRRYEKEAAQVEALEKDDKALRQNLSAIFGIEYKANKSTEEDMETIQAQQEKLNKLRQYTTDKEILDDIDHVAFDQDDLWDILDAGAKKVYLVNNTFEISLEDKEMTYIGVGKAIAKIDSEETVDFEELGIRFENVQFDEKYATIQEKSSRYAGHRRQERIRQYTTDSAVLERADRVAFNQEELDVLTKDENRDVFLCNGNFTVPIDVQHKRYIGIGKAVAIIESEEFVDFDALDIQFENVTFNEEFEKHYWGEKYYRVADVAYGEEDYNKAKEYYQKSAATGHAGGMCCLGLLYGRGEGVDKDSKEAVKWYQKAAEAGDDCAMNQLGWAYAHGEGIPQNEKKAVEWFRKGAEAGSPDAMNNMGWVYEHGQGVKQDNRIAVKWYRKAAEAGNGTGMNNLGLAYDNGTGVEQNEEEAVKWYRKAIECGDGCAAWNLSVTCDKNGDSEQAEHWRKKAKELGYEAKTEDGSDCFITTAVCSGFNKPDDCYELTMFRHFRDSWLLQQADGSALVNEYYRTAPHIVASIDHLKEAKAIYRVIWNEYLLPCLRYLEKQKYIECKTLYVKMVQDLQKQFLV